jgi:polar amino acid transport system substrate-binding protein
MNLTKMDIILLVILVVCLCLIVLILGFLVYQYTLGRGEVETAGDTSWSDVRKAGKIVVGTSADYPPFESYTPEFQLDGFDIALMKQIGEQLGVKVEFRDMAFDGLGNALILGQIDASISAISVTPQREAIISFSNIYLAGQDGILARQDAARETVTVVNELAAYRVGVQSGSSYYDWLYEELVATGLMPASKLLTFARIEDAVRDLKENRVDMVVMDLQPAKEFVAQGGVKLVGENLNPQYYAIAIPKGSQALRSEINQALTELLNEGVVSQLASQYLNIEPGQMPPTPTPGPTLPAPTQPAPTQPPPQTTITPPPSCIDGMAFVKDLTYPDFNMTVTAVIPPGTPFQKGWRIRNTGTCTWNTSYILRYAYGNQPASSMGGAPTPISGQVPPGAEYDLYVNLVSPLYPGTYQGVWQLHNPAGAAFGDRIWVGITVPVTNPATPTPPPAQPLIYRFGAQPLQIQVGQCTQLSWDVRGNVTSVQLTRNQAILWDGAPTVGYMADCPAPAGQVRYEIKASGPGGVATDFELVNVTTVPQPTLPPTPSGPSITQFTVAPQIIEAGQCVNIQWSVEGYADNIQMRRDGAIVLDYAPNNGTAQDCPPNPGVVVYRLEASGYGKVDFREMTVNVNQPPAPQEPQIAFFDAHPDEIQAGQCVEITWSVTGAASYIRLTRNGEMLVEAAAYSGTHHDCLANEGEYTYRLEAGGSKTIDVAEKAVKVSPAPEPSTSRELKLSAGWNTRVE